MNRNQKISRTIVLVALLFTVIVGFATPYLLFKSTPIYATTGITLATVLVSSLASLLTLRSLRTRAARNDHELVSRFGVLENRVRKLAYFAIRERAAGASIDELTTVIRDMGYWSKSDSKVFTEILKARNSIVHQRRSPGDYNARHLINSITGLAEKIPDYPESGRGFFSFVHAIIPQLRSLQEANPRRYREGFAALLADMGIRLSHIDARGDALSLSEEAVSVYRDLAEQSPDRYLPSLAASLTNLSNRMAEVGHITDAFEVSEEAVSIYRTLAAAFPDRYAPALAASLDNLGVR
ncbi:hypothetical protein ACWDR1_30135, partial [Streptosporangium sandarakinum]